MSSSLHQKIASLMSHDHVVCQETSYYLVKEPRAGRVQVVLASSSDGDIHICLNFAKEHGKIFHDCQEEFDALKGTYEALDGERRMLTLFDIPSRDAPKMIAAINKWFAERGYN